MRSVIAIPTASLLAGSAAGLSVAGAPWALAAFAGLFAAALAATLVAARRPGGHPALALSVALAFTAGGGALAVRASQAALRPPLRQAFDRVAPRGGGVVALVTGVLRADAVPRTDRTTLSLDVLSADLEGPAGDGAGGGATTITAGGGGLVASVGGRLAAGMAPGWRAGRVLRFPVRLREPTRHLDPGVGDEAGALARRGTVLIGTVKSGSLVEVLARGRPWTEAAARVRAYTRRAVARHVGRWSPQAAGIVTAILIGDRTGLAPEIERALQDAGTYHVIAISGGNIAILAGVILILFRWTGTLGRAARVAAACLLVAYGAIAAGGASVSRAVVTAVLYLLAGAIDQRTSPAQGLAVAAAGLVAADPLAMADPGFVFSCGATAAAIAAARWPLVDVAPALAAARSLVVTSIAAELALLPMAAAFFGRVTLAGPALNLVAIPAMTVAQIAGMLVVPLSAAAPPLASAAGAVAAIGAAALVESAAPGWVSTLAWRVARPNPWVVGLYYAAPSLAVGVWRARRARACTRPVVAVVADRAVAVLAVTWVGAALWIAAQPWTLAVSSGDGRLHVTFLDVGQGDAAFVRFPRGATLLVDSGGTASDTYDIGERVVGPVLRDAGVRRLGTVAVTHADTDHAGGAAAVAREFRPFDVWEGVPVPSVPSRERLAAAAWQAQARWTTLQRGDETDVDGVRVIVHHPEPPEWARQRPRNDDSVVLELRWGDVSIVLAGDIEQETESELAPRFVAARLRVLKVPHHGSRTSSTETFVRALRPALAVVSVGRGNPFGHPAPSVMQRYADLGAEIFRTDRDGAVTVDTDGRTLAARGYTGRTWRTP